MPPSLNRALVVASYELLRQLRRRRLYVLLGLEFAAIALWLALHPALGAEFPEEAGDAARFFVSGVAYWLIIVAGAFLAGDSLATEFEHKTAYVLFPNPVDRLEIALGKFLASLAIVSSLSAISYACATLFCLPYYGELPPRLAHSFGISLLFAACVIGISMLFSAALKRGLLASIIPFLLFFIVFPMETGIVGGMAGVEPVYDPSYQADAMSSILIEPPPPRHEVRSYGGMTIHTWTPDPAIAALVLAAYAIASLALAVLIFRRAEAA